MDERLHNDTGHEMTVATALTMHDFNFGHCCWRWGLQSVEHLSKEKLAHIQSNYILWHRKGGSGCSSLYALDVLREPWWTEPCSL